MKRAVQLFSDDYLEHCKSMAPSQIVNFLDNFRRLHSSKPSKRRLISLRVSEPVLIAVKLKAKTLGVPYQTQIHRLLEDWVKNNTANG